MNRPVALAHVESGVTLHKQGASVARVGCCGDVHRGGVLVGARQLWAAVAHVLGNFTVLDSVPLYKSTRGSHHDCSWLIFQAASLRIPPRPLQAVENATITRARQDVTTFGKGKSSSGRPMAFVSSTSIEMISMRSRRWGALLSQANHYHRAMGIADSRKNIKCPTPSSAQAHTNLLCLVTVLLLLHHLSEIPPSELFLQPRARESCRPNLGFCWPSCLSLHTWACFGTIVSLFPRKFPCAANTPDFRVVSRPQ